MADTPQTQALIVIAQNYAGDIVRQINRTSVALKLLAPRFRPMEGKNAAWVANADGAVAEAFASGADPSNFGSDAQAAALIPHGRYWAPFHVNGDALAAAATSRTPAGNIRLWALNMVEGCALLHDRLVRGVSSYMLECDERWSFIAKKEARVEPGKDPAEWGDVYTFVALDAVTKLVIAYYVGKRDQEGADAFIADLRARLTVVPQLATDGFAPYIEAIRAWFMGSIDYGQVVKNYRTGSKRGPDHRYEPPRDPFITKTPIFGAPDMARLSTSFVERNNLTMRHVVGRTRRLCLAFSKTLRGHRAAEALGFMAYNFVRQCIALDGQPPAMACGLADHPWTIGELMDAALAAEPCEVARPVRLALSPERAGRATGAARELPNGRGWLRVVDGKAGPAPQPEAPAPTPVAPAIPLVETSAVASSATPVDDRQLDLLTWRPKPNPLPPRGTQLNLFGEPEAVTNGEPHDVPPQGVPC